MKRILILIALFGLIAIVLPSCSSMKKKDGSLSESDLNAERDKRFGEGSIPLAEGEGMFRDVHFDYDSSRLNDQGRQEVEADVEVLKQNSDIKIQLEGHCDERGTAEYNMALGSHRAKAVMEALISYGIPSSRLESISYGSEVPLDPGHNEAAWSKNRRVHLSGFKGGSGGSASNSSAGSKAAKSDSDERRY